MKIALFIIAIIAVLGLLALIFSLISGAVAVIGGFFNTVLALVVVIALVLIVVWMFSFAKKMRK